MTRTTDGQLYGLLAELESADQLVVAARHVRDEGFVQCEAYAPFHIEGLAEAIGMKPTRLPWLVLLGGVVGLVSGYALQHYTSAIAYPMNVGGRPLVSWPAFVPVAFETTILFAALTAVIGMLALNRLPQPYHPLFDVPRFARATSSGFFLCIRAEDPSFDSLETKRLLEDAGATAVDEVPLP